LACPPQAGKGWVCSSSFLYLFAGCPRFRFLVPGSWGRLGFSSALYFSSNFELSTSGLLNFFPRVAYPLRFWPARRRQAKGGSALPPFLALFAGCPRCRFCTWVLGSVGVLFCYLLLFELSTFNFELSTSELLNFFPPGAPGSVVWSPGLRVAWPWRSIRLFKDESCRKRRQRGG
jgi:hypothetical protein